jgi:ribosomal protein L37AE/L43A
MKKRMPLIVDGLMTNNPCPNCGSHIIRRCQACAKWLCIGCLEKATLDYRKEKGFNTVGENVNVPP